MKRLLIADIHANLPAFEAVLRDAGSIDEIIFLGDVVGYGPHPSECVHLLQHIGARAILGNHDLDILSDPTLGPSGFDAHSIWRHWSYLELTSSQRNYLASLPGGITIASDEQWVEIIHNTPSKRYLHPAMPDELLAEQFRAVGQARDGDPKAGYAIEREGVLEHRAIAYDVERAVHDLPKIGLPEPFLARWIEFLRAGFDPEWSREYP